MLFYKIGVISIGQWFSKCAPWIPMGSMVT